ncbi:MAG TPA: hypothetical protein VMG41_02005 [Gemmatimonadales bacterium]|nr:hypothetical protein [Gemmatimonadales bacterium]
MSSPERERSRPWLGSRVWRTGLKLLLWLVVIGLLVVPLIRDLPLGDTTRAGILAWVLVGIGLYWLFTDLGYRPLLLFQLFFFSAAITLLTAKAALVSVGVHRGPILRRTAIWLLLLGAACAGVNVIIMFLELLRRGSRREK